MKYLLCFAFLTLVIVPSNAQNKQAIIKISPEHFTDQKVVLSDIADDIQYIPISTKVPISHIVRLQATDSLLFICAGIDAGILKYGRDGSFIGKIGRKGNGPGEYIRPGSITLDEINKKIYVTDLTKLLIYDFNGNFIRSINKAYFQNFPKIFYDNNKLYLFASLTNSKQNNSPFNWMIIDTMGNDLSHKKNTTSGFAESNEVRILESNIAYKYDKFLCYWNHYNDTIFGIHDTFCTPRYLFKQDKYRLTPATSQKSEVINGASSQYIIRAIHESNLYLFITYRQNSKNHLCIYDKKDKIFKNVTFQNEKMEGLTDDFDAGLPFLPKENLVLSNQSYLITWRNAYELKAHVASQAFKSSTPKYPEKKKALEKLANSLDENDNPVLMLVKLKE